MNSFSILSPIDEVALVLSSACKLVNSLTIHLVKLKLSNIVVTICKRTFSRTFLDTINPISFIDISTAIFHFAISLNLITLKIAFIKMTLNKIKSPFTFSFIFYPIALVLVTIRINIHPIAMSQVIFPSSIILFSSSKVCVNSIPISAIVPKLPSINITICSIVLTKPMLLSFSHLSFVNFPSARNKCSISIKFIISPTSKILISIFKFHKTLSMFFIFLVNFTFIDIAYSYLGSFNSRITKLFFEVLLKFLSLNLKLILFLFWRKRNLFKNDCVDVTVFSLGPPV